MEALRWAQQFALPEPRGDDAPRHRLRSRTGPGRSSGWRRSTATTTTPSGSSHFGKDVWLSRKGAIDAAEGVRGLIPGSMGAQSYVVTGKGQPSRAELLAARCRPQPLARGGASGCSPARTSTHGWPGIAWGQSDAFLDEHPDAYKDIDVVMNDAADLVEIDHTLRQIVNVKGD